MTNHFDSLLMINISCCYAGPNVQGNEIEIATEIATAHEGGDRRCGKIGSGSVTAIRNYAGRGDSNGPSPIRKWGRA